MSEPLHTPSFTPPSANKRLTRRRRALLVLATLTSVAAVGVATPSIGAAVQPEGTASSQTLQSEQDDSLDLEDGSWDDSSFDDTDFDDTDWVDPFEGMTDDEIDALTDDEFFAILDKADPGWDDGGLDDIDFDDADWVDPFEGMTDDEVDALTDDEFFAILDKADPGWDDDSNWDDTDWDDTDWGDFEDELPLAEFEVVNDELVGSGASAEQLAQAQAIWDRFMQIIPASERTMISGFELMSAEYGGAHVYADEADPTKWIIGFDLTLTGAESDYVLVHEFGHLLTLKASEVPPAEYNGETCPTFDSGEGCALNGSTLAAFVAAFWPQALQDELNEINNSDDWDKLDSFYEANADSFVSDYALTNPVEDLAETFTEFVLKDRPTGNTIADQKVLMLWADQDMVALRGDIRSRL